MISNTRYWLLISLIIGVYIIGMFAPLFENDSAQFAVMAMRMVQENDFLHLFKGPQEYLDKPHMHYWLAALSFKIFGIHDWAYRVPAILSSFLAAYSCWGLGKLLYNNTVGKLAALIFLSAQTIVLANIDVRTDAVLTGFASLAIWQLAVYIKTRNLLPILIGAVAAGIAFSTKGQIALLVIGFPLLCHIWYTKQWKAFAHWKVLVALAVFALTIVPMLYAYYIQFDLHPEKIIRGKGNRTGLFFIFWEQSFERLSGKGVGKNSNDYFFFFHTFLWVFLPWSFIAIAGYWTSLKSLVFKRLPKQAPNELLTLGGISLIFLIISFAQFKLPHYLNITIPLFSVLTAGYLYKLHHSNAIKTIRRVLIAQHIILGVVFVAVALICFFVFKIMGIYAVGAFIFILLICVVFCLKLDAPFKRLISISVCASVLLNFVLNAHFYPSLLQYEGGYTMAKEIKMANIPVNNIYKLSDAHTWALDFYNKKPVRITSIAVLPLLQQPWLYVTANELNSLKDLGYDWNRRYVVDQFRISRLQGRFLNPASRKKVVNQMYLVHLK